MKKKFTFIGMIVLALVLTTGTFAYTYSNTTTTTLEATIADAVMTTYQLSEHQPNWDSVLPEDEYGSEIIVPDAPGDDTELPSQFPDADLHWDKVDEQPTDEDATYISTQGVNSWERDLFNLGGYIGASGIETINNVKIYVRYAANGDHTARAMVAMKTHDQVYEGPSEATTGTDFVTISWENLTNPATGEAWTWEEINDLQAGVTMKGPSKTKAAICTQVYVQVYYNYANSQGEVPQGDLYVITPHPEYTGDLLVKIYLTNTAALLKAYQYINMKVYVANSLEAEDTPEYQILSIETGVIEFNIVGGTAESYTVSITGGSYRLVSSEPDNWGAGWTITPEFYCEVAQR
jgi:hypothetical protein